MISSSAPDEDRIGPAPFPDGSRDVGDLFAAVRPWIIRPGDQALDRPALDLNAYFDWGASMSDPSHTSQSQSDKSVVNSGR
jgi:hypothetical protein